MRLRLSLSLFISALSGCGTIPVDVTIPNTTVCAVHGKLSAGGGCAETITGKTSEMDLDQFLDFLEAREARPDPARPGQTLQAHGAALCQSASDYAKILYALQVACRDLGEHCTPEMKYAIALLTIRPPGYF